MQEYYLSEEDVVFKRKNLPLDQLIFLPRMHEYYLSKEKHSIKKEKYAAEAANFFYHE